MKYILPPALKKKNSKYLSLKKKKKNLKFFFHRNEKNVSERIFFLSKKIKNNYCLIVSGDCPIIDNNFIQLLYKKLSSKPLYDLVKFSKKVYIGDIIISYDFIDKPKSQKLKFFKEKLIKTFIHGFLHLLNFDHKKNKDYKKMLKEEKFIYQSVISRLN